MAHLPATPRRIGINGVGRIGRSLWRIIHTAAPDLAVVAANDTAELATVAHLLRYDSVRGRFPGRVETRTGALVVDGERVPLTHHPVPAQIDWAAHGVDLVIEATGQFGRGQAARGHLAGGAPTVVITTPTADADTCLMMGLNEHTYDPARHRVISNSSCSTYCLVAMLAPVQQAYGIRTASAVLAYPYGSAPGRLLDGVDPNPRLARANATNLVPANLPGLRYVLAHVLPAVAGKVAATAMRVPVRATSTASLTVRLSRPPADAEEVNATLHQAAASLLKGYLEVSTDPLVSADVLGSPASCVVDAGLTSMLGDLVRVVGWHDNEWGYPHRLVDLARLVTSRWETQQFSHPPHPPPVTQPAAPTAPQGPRAAPAPVGAQPAGTAAA